MPKIMKEQDQFTKRRLERVQLIGEVFAFLSDGISKSNMPYSVKLKAMIAIQEKIPQAVEKLA